MATGVVLERGDIEPRSDSNMELGIVPSEGRLEMSSRSDSDGRFLPFERTAAEPGHYRLRSRSIGDIWEGELTSDDSGTIQIVLRDVIVMNASLVDLRKRPIVAEHVGIGVRRLGDERELRVSAIPEDFEVFSDSPTVALLISRARLSDSGLCTIFRNTAARVQAIVDRQRVEVSMPLESSEAEVRDSQGAHVDVAILSLSADGERWMDYVGPRRGFRGRFVGLPHGLFHVRCAIRGQAGWWGESLVSLEPAATSRIVIDVDGESRSR
jgi:hypothetical protein